MPEFRLFDVSNSIEHQLVVGETLIGRSEECGIRLLSSSVSRKHGQFQFDGQQLRYTDLGSSNGSFINGNKVTGAQPLVHGDTLITGDFQFNIIDPVAQAAAGGDGTTRPASDREGLAGGHIPAMWSDSAGLEQASGTEFFREGSAEDVVKKYRLGTLPLPPMGSYPRLVGLSANVASQIFEFSPDTAKTTETGNRVWKLGRDALAVDIAIAENSISGMHAQVIQEGARWKIVNWMSTNGTFVNGHRALSNYLKHGDIIGMGATELAFELPPPSSAASKRNSTGGEAPKKRGFFARLFGIGK